MTDINVYIGESVDNRMIVVTEFDGHTLALEVSEARQLAEMITLTADMVEIHSNDVVVH